MFSRVFLLAEKERFELYNFLFVKSKLQRIDRNLTEKQARLLRSAPFLVDDPIAIYDLIRAVPRIDDDSVH